MPTFNHFPIWEQKNDPICFIRYVYPGSVQFRFGIHFGVFLLFFFFNPLYLLNIFYLYYFSQRKNQEDLEQLEKW